jgi:glycosyltransferase involved in cell wall biosynthesis
VTSSISVRDVRPADPLTRSRAIGVLHVVAPCEVGGLERVVHTLATGQHRAGHRVSVVVVLRHDAEDHPFLRPLVEGGIAFVPLRLPSRAYFRERAAVVEICRQIRPDVVHTHGYRVDVVDAAAARRLGVPTVTTVHGFTGGDWKNRLYERLQRRALRGFNAVVAVSRQLAAELARAGVPADRLHVVRNAWPEGDGGAAEPPLPRDRARRMLGVPADRFHIGWVGRLTAEKGLDVLLAALDSLRDVPLVVSVLGDGRLRPRLEALATRRGLGERVRWLGSLPAARQLFSAFDVFVLSSRAEGTPIVLFEAMAAGAPIVATAVGGVPDVVSSNEALLVPPEDPASLAEAIRRVYTDSTATAIRAGAARRRLESEFAVAPWLASYEHIYRAVQ